MNIHPLAVVSSKAQLGSDVSIGPFVVIEDDVLIGDGCTIDSHAVIKNRTRIGPRNAIREGAVIGGLPQHVACPTDTGQVIIGAGNTLREYVTVHRALKPDAKTIVGDNNYLMVGVHIAHDCIVGNNVIIANGTMLAGHVRVDDRAFLSGTVAVHQFCRIGRMAMVGGHARIVRDVLPFVTVDGQSGHIVGLNIVGLKRNGFTSSEIEVLKAAYRLIYRAGLAWKEMLAELAHEFAAGPAAPMLEFLQGGARGFTQERRAPARATIKLHGADESQQATDQRILKAKAG